MYTFLSEINSFAVFYNITFGNIDCDEGYIRIGVLLFSDGRSEQVTWHYNNGSTLGNSKIDGVDTLFIGILCRFVVLVLYAVCIAVGAYSFPGDLVEGFVGDISGVCDHGNFLTCGVFFFLRLWKQKRKLRWWNRRLWMRRRKRSRWRNRILRVQQLSWRLQAVS